MASFTPARVPDDELKDFQLGCRQMGFDPGSFTVRAADEHPVDPAPVRRVVVVSRGRVSRSYGADGAHAWVAPALADVGAGVFPQR